MSYINKFFLFICLGICVLGIHCKRADGQLVEFKKILVLGNSITLHSPNANVNWRGNWGMAASQPGKDFVHILAARLNAEVVPANISDWERSHTTFQLANYDKHFVRDWDLVILRMGENVLDINGFEKSLMELLLYIRKQDPNATIVITGTFWKQPLVNRVLNTVALKNGLPFVPLYELDTKENKSFIGANLKAEDGSAYQLSDEGVAAHPGDAGMEAIAEAIIQIITKIRITK